MLHSLPVLRGWAVGLAMFLAAAFVASVEASSPAETVDLEAGRKYWAFQPVRRPPLPRIHDADAANPVDLFILARLQEKGLRPAEPADKRTLIRRATYDLTGLPPTPEEIDAFLKDDSPDAFARVVERLLASPAYGERWGRHWLDVVRYADTAGDNSDYPIPQMYRYRNWVIDAFNRDLPYDLFIRLQLAGDLMAENEELPSAHVQDRSEAIIATGYLANARRFGSYEDARYPWHLTIEDTLDNLGKTFLGLTLGCARCHDHKFDPLSAEDYYALYGFFSSTRYPWPGIELDKVPRDLVPLAPPAEVQRLQKERQQQLAALDATIKQLEKRNQDARAVRKERDQLAKKPLPHASAYAVIDGRNEPRKRIGIVGNARLQIKGDPEHPGKEVPRRFPLILGGHRLPAEVKGSGRRHLADWIADPANPLTARVLVNRIWQYHFGKGIVPTPNDFGKQGQPPTHPELLDYLADTFVRPDQGAWSIKKVHRLIMLSRTYQQASRDDDVNLRIDVGNDYLWRYPRRRLDAESIRDTLLAVSGSLDRSRGGPHPFPEQDTWNFTQHRPFKAVYETNRRSVYLMTQRIQRHPFLALFDGPDTNASTAGRVVTTTPLQALYLMNDPFMHEQARKLAERLQAERSEDGARIEQAYLLLFGRPPTADEQSLGMEYLARVRQRLAGFPEEQRSPRAWESLLRSLFLSNELIYVN